MCYLFGFFVHLWWRRVIGVDSISVQRVNSAFIIVAIWFSCSNKRIYIAIKKLSLCWGKRFRYFRWFCDGNWDFMSGEFNAIGRIYQNIVGWALRASYMKDSMSFLWAFNYRNQSEGVFVFNFQLLLAHKWTFPGVF